VLRSTVGVPLIRNSEPVAEVLKGSDGFLEVWGIGRGASLEQLERKIGVFELWVVLFAVCHNNIIKMN